MGPERDESLARGCPARLDVAREKNCLHRSYLTLFIKGGSYATVSFRLIPSIF